MSSIIIHRASSLKANILVSQDFKDILHECSNPGGSCRQLLAWVGKKYKLINNGCVVYVSLCLMNNHDLTKLFLVNQSPVQLSAPDCRQLGTKRIFHWRIIRNLNKLSIWNDHWSHSRRVPVSGTGSRLYPSPYSFLYFVFPYFDIPYNCSAVLHCAVQIFLIKVKSHTFEPIIA